MMILSRSASSGTPTGPSDEHAALAALTSANGDGCTQHESVPTFAAPAEQIAESRRHGGDQQVIDGAAAGVRGGSKPVDGIPQHCEVALATNRPGQRGGGRRASTCMRYCAQRTRRSL